MMAHDDEVDFVEMSPRPHHMAEMAFSTRVQCGLRYHLGRHNDGDERVLAEIAVNSFKRANMILILWMGWGFINAQRHFYVIIFMRRVYCVL